MKEDSERTEVDQDSEHRRDLEVVVVGQEEMAQSCARPDPLRHDGAEKSHDDSDVHAGEEIGKRVGEPHPKKNVERTSSENPQHVELSLL